MIPIKINKLFSKFLSALVDALDLRKTTAQACCRAALSITLASVLAILFNTSIPYWAAISAAVVSLNYYQASANKAVLRIVGTVAGAVLGALLSYFIGTNELLFLFTTTALIGLGFYASQSSRFSYAFFMCSITAIITIATHFASHTDVWLAAYDRSLEISLGVLSGLFCSRFIFYNDAEKEFRQNLTRFYEILIQMIEAKRLTDILSFRKELKKLVTKDQKLIDIFFNDLKVLPISNQQAEQLFQTQKNLLSALDYFFKLGLDSDPAILDSLQPVQEALIKMLTLLKEHDFEKFIELYKENHHIIFTKSNNSQNFYFELYEIIFLHSTDVKKILTKEPVNLPAIKPWQEQQHAHEIMQQNLMFTLKTALSFFVATAFWFNFGGVAAVQGMITTMVLVPQKNLFDQANTAKLRVYGAIIGAVIGISILKIFPYHLTSMALLVFIAGWFFSYLYLFGSANQKSIALQANVAFIIATVHISSAAAHAQLIQRLWGVSLGVGVILIINWLVWPQHPRTLLKYEIQKISKIYQSLLNLFTQPNEHNAIKAKFEEINWRLKVCDNLLESMANLLGIKNRRYLLFKSFVYRLTEIESCLYVWWLLLENSTDKQVELSETFIHETTQLLANFNEQLKVNSGNKKQILSNLTQLKNLLRQQAQKTTQ